MLVVIDINHYLPDRNDTDLDTYLRFKEMLRYHLYREYHLETGTYFLSNRDLAAYCRMKDVFLVEFSRIGTIALHHDRRHAVIKIRNRDAYVALLREPLDARRA